MPDAHQLGQSASGREKVQWLRISDARKRVFGKGLINTDAFFVRIGENLMLMPRALRVLSVLS
jgi:hypothetical protein